MSGTKRSVRSVWYVSYLVVLLIPSIAALLIYYFASDALHQQIRETNRAFLQLLEENMESSVEYADRMANMLVVSPEFTAVRNFGTDLSASNRYQLYRFITNNLRAGLSDQFIHQQFIYLHNSRMVLTQAVYQEAEKAKGVILADWALSEQTYWDLITSPQERRYLPAAVGATPVVLYAQSLPYGSRKPDVTLVVAFSRPAILSVLDAAAWSGDGLVCVLDNNNAMILSSGNPDLDAAALGESASLLGENEITLNGRR
ncbi:MAG TPA: hypothetical protein PKE04_14720, partial [Clostridia bacterium]|nr:hypothetical protein [Clostridia bacterium]